MLFRYRCAAATAALIGLMLVAGCGSKDTGQTAVEFDPEKSRMEQQAAYDKIKNDPKIPDEQKQAILARMGGAAAMGEGGKTAAETAGKAGAPTGGDKK